MIHPDAQSFNLAAAAYERGRPDYPADAVNTIVQALGIGAESTVVDLAAGTGKFTRLLVPTGAHIIAVEPVRGMRTTLSELVPGIEIWEGTAESIPLPDASVDAVTVAQAFHWFQPEEATAEIHRVLRPGGGLALIWNRRDLKQPLQQAIHDIITPYRGTASTRDSHHWKEGFDRTTLFTPLQKQRFPHSQNTDTAGLIDRVLSFSYMATLPQSEKDAVSKRLRALTSTLSERFDLMYMTVVFCCHSREVASS
ncbi:MAG TPA: class I SAM-dependent methyltransferase [Rubrobacter sp.]|jgi:ubiquinone/menaquinone biosynthesis C-methylase UbiE|nr:class I SAM-dependent methyltransferase [Rubrobacter sp.]